MQLVMFFLRKDAKIVRVIVVRVSVLVMDLKRINTTLLAGLVGLCSAPSNDLVSFFLGKYTHDRFPRRLELTVLGVLLAFRYKGYAVQFGVTSEYG